jgi:hypothetical protein
LFLYVGRRRQQGYSQHILIENRIFGPCGRKASVASKILSASMLDPAAIADFPGEIMVSGRYRSAFAGGALV